ncbi:hypothetical protein [Microbacterium sp. SCN 70-27]|nr:hypothetical protein [Microbacterium sp. SCN 70-27]MBN9223705.1 hypothetical protein [Microbacterium sp.]
MSWSDLGMPEPPEPSGNETPGPRPAKAPKPPKPAKEPKQPRQARQASPADEGGGGGSRTPLVLGIVAAVLFVAVVVTLAVALTRPRDEASPAPAPPPSSSEAPAPAPSQSQTTAPDEVGEPTALDFSGAGFTLVDDDKRTVFTFGWRDDVAPAVSALTKAFGAPPTQRVEPGDGSHYPDYTVYQWDGFMLFDMIPTPGGTSRADYAQPSYALFSRNEVGGIAMTAEHGLTIGMTVDAVRAATPDAEIPRGNVGAIRFAFDTARSSIGDPLQYSTFADTDGTVVTRVLYYLYSQL